MPFATLTSRSTARLQHWFIIKKSGGGIERKKWIDALIECILAVNSHTSWYKKYLHVPERLPARR